MKSPCDRRQQVVGGASRRNSGLQNQEKNRETFPVFLLQVSNQNLRTDVQILVALLEFSLMQRDTCGATRTLVLLSAAAAAGRGVRGGGGVAVFSYQVVVLP